MKTLLILLFAGIMNPSYSPDSTKVAFTKGGDLYVSVVGSTDTLRLTDDGTDVIMNGYASWVYYEEIFGRSSNYRAFWWSPDSKKLAYYRFDDSSVSVFPIFSPFGGANGKLRQTRYPKAGAPNPVVAVKVADLEKGSTLTLMDGDGDGYFGIPFWSADSRELYVSCMPRRQNRLDLYAVAVGDASKRQVYHEEYPTWVDWMQDMLFSGKGLYMVRCFETGWEQIYFLGYDGTLRRLTDAQNWDIRLLRLSPDGKKLYFTAKRDSRVHPALYCLDLRKSRGMGKVSALTDPSMYARNVTVADDGTFAATLDTADPSPYGSHPQLLKIQNDGFDLYGLVTYPRDFDPSRKYPVIMEVYGGPGTAYVRDWCSNRDASNQWCFENGIIYMVVDPRTSGENGRRGMDESFKRMTVIELQDYIAWARYLQGLPYVDGGHIGVDGFSFGGTTTAMLVLRYPEYFRCGIAGGGVYDWTLYDSHYTERFMCTPQENPEGYREASVMHYVENGLISPLYKPYSLKLTHGTGDDNVHFQNTLLLADALQRKGVLFDFMVYPDGMHGYRGLQAAHSKADDAEFWKRNLFE